jgi:hypothetical protein
MTISWGRLIVALADRKAFKPITTETSGHFDCDQNRSVRRSVRNGWKKKLRKINGISSTQGPLEPADTSITLKEV